METNESSLQRPAAQIGTPDDGLALRGGLRGRMAGTFCTLQSSLEALQRYLVCNASPQVRRETLPLLQAMFDSIAGLERLCANSARLATGVLTRGSEELAPLELGGYLKELTDCANEELALRGFPARIRFLDESGAAGTWTMADGSLLDGILMNLLSNLLQLRRDGVLSLTLRPDRALCCADNGPGMELSAARALLEQGQPSGELLGRGALGLLLVRDYAAAMDWRITVEPGPGLCIRFALPGNVPPAGLTLRDSVRSRGAAMRADLRRELDGVFGTARPDGE
mgnify:FL=1